MREKGQSLTWRWRGGESAPVEALGDPRSTDGTRYVLCARDGADSLVVRTEAPPGGACGDRPCWRALGSAGFSYQATRGGAALRSLLVTRRGRGRRRPEVGATAKGPALIGGDLPVTLPITVQLEADTGACWSASFTAADVTVNGNGRFTAASR